MQFLAPIPGGCNLSFQTEIAPYQIVKTFHDIIRVDMQLPSSPGVLCEDSNTHVELYHVFADNAIASESEYFDYVKRMLTPDGIRRFGKKVSVVFYFI